MSKEEKLYTLDEFDRATLAQFQSGVAAGILRSSEVTAKTIHRFKTSMSDVWEIYNQGFITPEKKVVINQMVFAIDLLETLSDVLFELLDEEIVSSQNLEQEDDE
jgi:hypothetical protein